MARPEVTLEVGEDGVAVISMSNPPVNALAISSKLSSIQNLPSIISLNFFQKKKFVFVCVFRFLFFVLIFLVGAVFAGLQEKFDEATMRNDVKAIVLTGEQYHCLNFYFALIFSGFFLVSRLFCNEGKGGKFSGGFDINVFEEIHKNGTRFIQSLLCFDRIFWTRLAVAELLLLLLVNRRRKTKL